MENKKIVRLVGIGFDAEDQHVRLTHGNHYDIWMGSEESHVYLQKLMERIDQALLEKGKVLNEITPSELSAIVQSFES